MNDSVSFDMTQLEEAWRFYCVGLALTRWRGRS